MSNKAQFVIAPTIEVINELIQSRGLSKKDISNILGTPFSELIKYVNGSAPLSCEIAEKLSVALGGSKNYWLERDKSYREYLAIEEEKLLAAKTWLARFPVSSMFAYSSRETSRKFQDKLDLCFDFFDVDSIEEWTSKYSFMMNRAAFRTSNSFDSSAEAVVTWLRYGEQASKKISAPQFSKEKLKEKLPKIRELTREKQLSNFVPALINMLLECGVIIIFQKTPKGCSASGATLFSGGRAIIMQSFRYLSDDHFWFTLFHEIGHLLLHGESSVFIETKDGASEQEEKEADNFAQKTLIPDQYEALIQNLNIRNWKRIPRVARDIGISSGILVGQLQHRGSIKYSELNRLKSRYTSEELSSFFSH